MSSNHPLNTQRYVQLVGLFAEFLRLKIKLMEHKLKEIKRKEDDKYEEKYSIMEIFNTMGANILTIDDKIIIESPIGGLSPIQTQQVIEMLQRLELKNE